MYSLCTTWFQESKPLCTADAAQASKKRVRLIDWSKPLTPLRTSLVQLGNTGYEPSRKRTRKSDCTHAAATRRQTRPTSEIKLYSKKHRLECPRIWHVPGHLRLPWQYVKLDEQSNSAARWVPSNGCSKGLILKESDKSSWHMHAQRAAMPSPNDQVSYLRVQLAHREAQLEQVRAEQDNHFVQEEEF